MRLSSLSRDELERRQQRYEDEARDLRSRIRSAPTNTAKKNLERSLRSTDRELKQIHTDQERRSRHNEINYHANDELVYGHSLTHSKDYQKSVGADVARREHNKAARIMKRRGFKHETPFHDRVR